MNEELRQSLATNARALSQRVLDRMYENPFWLERYGARGRRFADEDSLYHVQFLDQALAADDAAVFEKYARWLRTVLVSRGMCSEHLAENFRLLADEIAALALPSSHVAGAILDRGVTALVYSEGDAAVLEAHRPELLAAVERPDAATHMRDDDRRYLVSYLIDATAIGDWQWFDGFAGRCPRDVVAALREAATASPGRDRAPRPEPPAGA